MSPSRLPFCKLGRKAEQKFNQLAGLDVSDDNALERYLDLNSYVGVSSPGFLRMFSADAPPDVGASPEEAKTYASRPDELERSMIVE